MEGASVGGFKGLRGYWRRRSYWRLGGSSGSRRRMPVVELGSTRRRRRWSWRIKISPKLSTLRSPKKFLLWPKKFLIWLCDGYVNMMLGFADSRVGGGYSADVGLRGFGSRPLKEYDQKVIVEVYKALMAAQAKAVTTRSTTRVAPSRFPLATISEIM